MCDKLFDVAANSSVLWAVHACVDSYVHTAVVRVLAVCWAQCRHVNVCACVYADSTSSCRNSG